MEVRLFTVDAAQFLAEMFETELCSTCFGDAQDHAVVPCPLGLPFARCTLKAPDGFRLVVGGRREPRVQVLPVTELEGRSGFESVWSMPVGLEGDGVDVLRAWRESAVAAAA